MFAGGEALRESGDPVTHAHLPTEGVLAALCITSSGSTVETGLVGREGVIPSIVERESLDTSRRVLALTDVTGWRIDLAELAALVNQRPGLRETFQAYAGRVLREAEARLAGAVLQTADQRLAELLLRLHDRLDGDEINITQEMLAGLLGSQRTTINEAAQALQELGVIRYRRGRISILRRGALEHASQGGLLRGNAAASTAPAGNKDPSPARRGGEASASQRVGSQLSE